ncbi:MAG: cache domain-containing protein [Acidobacteria bacterium]|nr:cache domain-containing protein [Acidobacteriota bacterium]
MLKKSRLGIQPRILIMFLLLSTIPLLLGAWVLFSHSESCYLETKSDQLSNMAEITILQIRNHFRDLSRLVDTLSFNTAVRDAVVASNMTGNTAELQARATAMEALWGALPPEDPRVQAVISGDLPDYLRKFFHRYAEVVDEISILNSVGAVIAATHKPRNYYQGGEDWYARVEERYLKEHEGTFSEIKYEQTLGRTPFKTEIAVPVFDPEENAFIGMIKCTIQITSINGIVRPFNFQNTGQAVVMTEDGTILSSRNYDLSDQVSYEFFEKARAILDDTNYPKFFYVIEDDDEPRRLMGLPKSRLSSFFPELKWYIFTDQIYTEAVEPAQGLKGTAMVYIAVMFILILVLALWFSKILCRPTIETDLHLEKL